MPRVALLVPVFLLLASLPASAQPEPSAPLFAEDWETGMDGWRAQNTTLTGVACDAQPANCYLRTAPLCCSTFEIVERTVDIPLPADAALVTSFKFAGDSTSSDTDSTFILQTDAGQVHLHVSAGSSANTGLLLQTPRGSSSFWSWGQTNAFHRVEIVIIDGFVHARAYDPLGVHRATSATIPLGVGASVVEEVRILGVSWTQRRSEFRYDDIVIMTTSECSPLVAGLATSASDGEAVFDAELRPSLAGGAPRCGAPSWSLDFGDGTAPLTGTGAPPGSVLHAYATPGTYVARLEATLGLATSSATTTIRVYDCLPFTVSLGATNARGPAPLTAQLHPGVSVTSRCAATWRLDFGDGSAPLEGTGMPPASVQHTFDEPIHATPVFSLTLGGTTKNATADVRAGPLVQHANGSIAATQPILRQPRVTLDETRVALRAESEGASPITLTWTSLDGASDLDIIFLTPWGQRIATTECAQTGPTGVESCFVPRDTREVIVSARSGLLIEWELEYHYS